MRLFVYLKVKLMGGEGIDSGLLTLTLRAASPSKIASCDFVEPSLPDTQFIPLLIQTFGLHQ